MEYTAPPSEPIAIVGCSCRFPGPATTPSKLWELLQKPYDLSKKTPSERFNVDGFYHTNGEYHGTTNAPKAYWMEEDIRCFDASFFNTTPKEAETIDPQGKFLLEVVYEAMESTGLTIQGSAGQNIGVFVGLMTADYELLTAKDEVAASQYCVTGTSRAIISNRISYFFNWNGPSMTIDTACSSSLVALHQAVHSLRSGESTMACVAGVNIMLSPDAFTIESNLHMLSPDGRSKMWDESANGYARGEGVSVLFLKPLSQALADGDQIECVIRETGVNSDGRTKGITMPSPTAQAALIQDTYKRSGLDAMNASHRCQYFEAHGTGTQAGDPREAEAIHTAFFGSPSPANPTDGDRLLVGSIKTVIGHTEGAAGVAGVMKTMLAMQKGMIPPNQHFNNVNPKVEPFTKRLKVTMEPIPWPSPPPGQPMRGSVNSFGFGGTNAHAILERYEARYHGESSYPQTSIGEHVSGLSLPLLLSADSDKSLARMAKEHLTYIDKMPNADLESLKSTLAFHRSVFPHKISVVSSDKPTLVQQLTKMIQTWESNPQSDFGVRTKSSDSVGRILGIFTGQGAQWASMGSLLIEKSNFFRHSLEELDEALRHCPDPPEWSIIQELVRVEGDSHLHKASISQPLCTAIQIALVDLLHHAGVEFAAVVGHSSGEIGAAYAAGRLSKRDAILIAYYRGVHAKLASSPDGTSGGMMAVGMSVDEAMDFCGQEALNGRVFIAASNAPASVTLSGDLGSIERAKEMLDNEKKFCRQLRVDTAYHSHHMDRCAGPYIQSLDACGIHVKAPRNSCIWVSSVFGPAGAPTTKELEGKYWSDNMVQPVLFHEALHRALTENESFSVVLEVGPHPALKGPAMQTIQEAIGATLPYSGVLQRGRDDTLALTDALGMVWCHLGSKAVDFATYNTAFTSSTASLKVLKGLPPYPWDHSQMYHRKPRLMRQYLHRPAAPHEILGVRTSDETPTEYRWRNILKPSLLPWIQDHRFQGQIIFPAAGYCIMALDAAKDMALGNERVATAVNIEDMVISNGITMEDDSQGVETIFTLQQDLTQSDDDQIAARFTLDWSPMNGDRKMKQAVSGVVFVKTETVQLQDTLPRRSPQQKLLHKVNIDEFYDSIQDIGLIYTGPFRALHSLQRRMNFAVAQLDKPHPEDTSRLATRPAMLDACFQTAFAAFAAPNDGALWTAFLPQSIRSLRFDLNLCEVKPDITQTLDVEATVTCFNPTTASAQASFAGDIEIFNEEGCMEIQIEGLTVQSFAASTESDDRELYIQSIYLRDPWTGFDEPVFEHSPSVDRELAAICDKIVQLYSPRTVPPLRCLGEEEVANMIKSRIELLPYKHNLEMLMACGLEMPLLLPALSKQIQQESLETRSLARHLTSVVRHISHRHPRINVLELDLGNALSMTSDVFSGLARHCASYIYAFLEDSLVPDVMEQLPTNRPQKISKKSLARDNPIESLELEPQGLDLVIISCPSAAHSKMEAHFTALAQFIKPGGFILTLDFQGQLLRDRLLGVFRPENRLGMFGMPTTGRERSAPPFADFGPTLHSFTSSSTNASLWVQQMTDPHIKILHEPLTDAGSIDISGNILIVGGMRPETAKIRDFLGQVLQRYPCWPKLVRSLEEVTSDDLLNLRSAIILSDLDDPIMENMSKLGLDNLKSIFAPNRYVLWLTQGYRAKNPIYAASAGLARTLRGETPQLTLQFLDLDALSNTEEIVAETFLRLAFMCEREPTPTMWTVETELVLEDGKVLIPRIMPIPELNDRLNSIRRVVTTQLDISNTAVTLQPQNEAGKLIYHVSDTKMTPLKLTHQQMPSQTIVRTLYSSTWALGIRTDDYLYAGVGMTVEGAKVLFVSRTNSSWVQVPTSWTLELHTPNNMSDAQAATAFVMTLIARRILTIGMDDAVVILGADSLFASVMDTVVASWVPSPAPVDIVFANSDQSLTRKDQRLRYIHPQSAQRLLQSVLPKNSGYLFDLTDSSASTIAKLQSTGWTDDSTSLANHSSLYSPYEESDSDIAKLLSDARDLTVLSASPAKRETNAPRMATQEIVGFGMLPYISVVDWTAETMASEQIRPLEIGRLLDHSKTYLLVGMTGDLGESLCRLMAANGAQHFVVASRNPAKADVWARDLRCTGVAVHLMTLDVTKMAEVQNLKQKLDATHPPVGGIINGAMLLSDGLFSDMTLESLQQVLAPKVTGSQNLSQVYNQPDLDFFIMFSSLTCIGGNSGQSNYTAANLFMGALAAKRRSLGLAASTIDIGVLYGIGYVNRVEGAKIYSNLRRQGYLPISEQDIHHMFAEAILAGRVDSGSSPQISTGLQRWDPTTDVPLPWHSDPRFSHHIVDSHDTPQMHIPGSNQTLKQVLDDSSTETEIIDSLQRAFATHLESMLHLPPGSVSPDASIIDLGVDSLVAVEIRSWFLKEVDKDVPVLKILGGSSIAKLCADVANEIQEDRVNSEPLENKNTYESDDSSSSDDDSNKLNLFNMGPLNYSTDLTSVDSDGEVTFDQIATMSFSQSRLWFPFKLLDDPTTYNCTTSYRLCGALDVERLDAALQCIIRKHQVFRTYFYTDHSSGNAMQAISNISPFELKIVRNADQELQVDHETDLVSKHVFNLEEGDSFIATLLEHADQVHTIIFGYHHIALDGVSWQQFLQELERFYIDPSKSLHQPYDYIDFSIKQRVEANSSGTLKKRNFWKDYFAELPLPIPLFPFARASSRKALQRYEVTEYFVELDQALVARIKDMATANHCTTFHYYLAALQVMLCRLLGIENVCIGITDANRTDQNFMNTIGLMLDSLPLWFRLQSDMESFKDRLLNTRDTTYTALANSGVPLDTILEDAGVETSSTNLPLFQVLVNYRMGAIKHKTLGNDIALEFLAYEDARHPFDYILTVDEDEGRGGLTLSMQNYLYDQTAGNLFLRIYINLLDTFSRASDLLIKEPPILPTLLRQEALNLGRGEMSSIARPATLPAQVDKMVSKFSGDTAIKDGSRILSYREMSAMIHTIAMSLRQKGVTINQRVGVFGGPSVDVVLSLLALLRLGAVYVPLDERNSDERITSMILDAKLQVIIHSEPAAQRVSAIVSHTSPVGMVVVPSKPNPKFEDVEDLSSHNALAMIMFTSGSTGKPKGIMLKHQNLWTHVQAATSAMRLGRETVLHQSALGYDASLAQIFYALANGGTLVVSDNRQEMSEIAALMTRENVSLTLMAPSEYAVLFQYGATSLRRCSSWRVAMCGGEAFPPRLRLSFRDLSMCDLTVWNAYGPTELSVASNIGLVDYQNAALDQQGRIPIGKALPGYHVCMVDEGNRPLPIGFVGQIAVSGSGVSAGYLEDAELTRAKFLSGTTLPSELSTDSKARWYLTGDIGRMEDDGRIIYMGRIDQDSQVKLRGIRIELMEISNSILQAANGAISQAVVGIRGEDINQFLVAYIVYTSTNKPEDPQEYLARLLAALPLPVYMRPSQGIALERLPMTNSGKLDMKALAAMTIPRKTPIQDGVSQPLTPIQSKLRDIWLKVLGDNDIKIAKDSNFFSSGGNSLLLLKVQAEIRNTFAKDIKLPELFRIDTLEHLAQKIQGDVEAHGDGERSSNAIDWALETALPNFQSMPQTLTQKRPIAQRSNGQINVILTGATGFLGGSIARALQSQPQVQQIHCIAVRNPASAAAQSLLLDCPKVILYSGDLSQPRLGLGEDEARLLLADAAAVIHNGADVSFMKTYETLRDINVGSTQQLVQLCLEATGGPVPIHFVSTAGVGAVLVAEAAQKGQGASALQLKRKSLELHPPPRTSGLVDGYVASKWTSEVVLEKTSKATGLPVRVYRPSSITGVNAPDLDIVHNVIHLSRSMRAVPDMTGWGGWFDLVTVQTAAKMITDGVMETHAEVKELLEFVHVSGEQVVAVSDVKSLLESETGYAFRQLDMAAWLREATQHGMSPLVAAYLSTTSGDSAVLPWFPRIEST